jgi:putative ABC transport system permease protein
VSLLYLLQTCARSILRNKMRSLLTSLGIIIGVASVVVMTAIGQGTQNEIETRISSMGTNLLQIGSQRMIFRPGQTSFARPGRISVKDKEKIAAENSFAAAVSGLSQRNFTCIGTEGSTSIQVMGVEPPYLQIRGWNIDRGTMFGDEENAERQRVAVLGSATAESLFGGTVEALGQTMRLGDGPWIIVGILEGHGDAGGMQSSDDLVLVPLRTYLPRLAPSSYLSSIMVSVAGKA